MRKVLLVLCLSVFSLVQAQSLDGFNKRFVMVRNQDQNLVAIKDSSLSFNFKISQFLTQIQDLISEEKAVRSSHANYEEELIELLYDGDYSRANMDREQISIMAKAIEALRKIDFDKIINNPKFQKVTKQYESKLQEALLTIDPTVMANVQDPKFFWKRHVGYEVVKMGLNLAKKFLGEIPVLNTASYVIVEFEKLIRERRHYHQNMLLFYLENFPETQLGMTKKEADYIFSSVYESQIPWYAFWESNQAAASWHKFGTDKFFAAIRVANNKMYQYETEYEALGERLNFAFKKASVNGDEVILNLFDQRNMFNPRPAIAYNYSDKNKILRTRALLKLAELGLSYISIPDFIKGTVNNYIKSFYDQHRLTEGALYGYFEAYENDEMKKSILLQNLNPFETL